jgi:hypothetical protein
MGMLGTDARASAASNPERFSGVRGNECLEKLKSRISVKGVTPASTNVQFALLDLMAQERGQGWPLSLRSMFG